MGTRPFGDGDTFATFRALREGTLREIDALENEYVLKASPTELEEYYVSKVTVTPLSLADAVANLRRDVDSHNQSARQAVRSAIAKKREKAQSAVGAVAALGIPIEQRSQPLTFTVPTKRRQSPVTRPQVATENFAPEPVLDQKEYEHILGVLRSMSLVIERNPGAFASLGEEDVRTHLETFLDIGMPGGEDRRSCPLTGFPYSARPRTISSPPYKRLYCQRSASEIRTFGNSSGLIVSFWSGVRSEQNLVPAGSL